MTIFQVIKLSAVWAKAMAALTLWRLTKRPCYRLAHISVGDALIVCQIYGQGEPVLLLHGGFGYAEIWAAQVPALVEAGFQVIAVDARGHGRSTLGDKPISYQQLADDISRLLLALSLDAVHLVGWSDGGCTGLKLAVERPHLLRSLTLVGTPFSLDNYSDLAMTAIREFLDDSVALNTALFLRQRLTPEPAIKPLFLERMTSMWLHEPDMTAADLARIALPTLIVGGDKDEFLSCWPDPLQVFQQTAAAIRASEQAVIRGGDHSLHLNAAAEFNSVVIGFLRRHRQAPL